MHIDWDDLQTVEALVRTGSVVGAARELSLRHSSVSRRVDMLERTLGAPLFVRGARLVPTPLARAIASRAGEMRLHARTIESMVEGQQRTRAGKVVITTNDVLAPLLFGALASSPLAPRVEVLVSDSVRELAPGLVDLALRPSQEPGGALRGRRLGRLRLGVFRARRSPASWVLPAQALREKASMLWWKVVPHDAPGVVECDSLLAMRDACVAGLGHAVLPAFLASGDGRLVLEREVEGGTPVWLLSPAMRGADEALRRVREGLARALRDVSGAWA